MQKTALSKSVFTLSDFLTPAECTEFIARADEIGWEEAKITTRGGQRMLKSVRNNDRAFLKDEALAAALFERLRPHVPEKYRTRTPVGLNELFRLYRYFPGQRFKMHVDGAYVRNPNEASALTFLIYLNEDFAGGATRFLNHVVQPKTGMALCFVHSIAHEGKEVFRGTKYVLRTDVMYAR
ncbi:MAG: 2OG-Fe(II) oxygenase [Bacteroidota bacterium]